MHRFLKRSLSRLLFVLSIFVLAACNPEANTAIRVRVLIDGGSLALSANEPMSVSQFLQRNNVILGELDRVDPSDFTLIADNMTITVVRVTERVECLTEPVAFKTETLPVPELPPGERQIVQAGVNGEAQVCSTVTYENGTEKSRLKGQSTVLKQPVSQVIAVGVDKSRIEPITFRGTIVYLAGGQARAIQGKSTEQLLLATGGDLDGRVLALSPDGKSLLYTRKKSGNGRATAQATGTAVPTESAPGSQIGDLCGFENELWVLSDIGNPDAQPTRLILENVLSAAWRPGQPGMFSFSTFEPRPDAPCYQALNDLTFAQLDTNTGRLLSANPVIPARSVGVYGTWGMAFRWSPSGTALAWSLPDSIGIVDAQKGNYIKLIDFPIYSTTLSRGWLWKPSLAWSSDGTLLTAAVHGAPTANEPPENSPAFDLVVTSPGRYTIPRLRGEVGMWSAPEYSPLMARIGSEDRPFGYIAYLQARDPVDSVSSEYQLVIADRDGSNPRVVFPPEDRIGLRPIDDGSGFAWSPDGSQIALVYQGDVYIVDVGSGRATRVTLVENARLPQWGDPQ